MGFVSTFTPIVVPWGRTNTASSISPDNQPNQASALTNSLVSASCPTRTSSQRPLPHILSVYTQDQALSRSIITESPYVMLTNTQGWRLDGVGDSMVKHVIVNVL
jgi:hypothetical protein